MRRREYLIAASGAVLGTGLAGCLGGNGDDGSGDSAGTLTTRVIDQLGDIADFESCVVTVTEIRVKPSGSGATDDGETATETEAAEAAEADDGETATETEAAETVETNDKEINSDGEGEARIDVDDAEADLVELQDEETELVSEAELETGEYEYLKLEVSDVDAELSGGDEAEVDTPGNAPLKFNESFEVRAETRTVFTADFTPVKRGQQDSYILKPVAEGVEVEYDSEGESGTETETESENGIESDSDTATATPTMGE